MLEHVKQQVKELVVELKRVNWPNRSKVFGATYSVAIIALLVGLFLWITDWMLSLGISYILKSC